MDGYKRAPHKSLIEEAIEAKGASYAEASKQTFRSDALAIFESLLEQTDEVTVVDALTKQGFKSAEMFLSTFRALAAVAQARRPPN